MADNSIGIVFWLLAIAVVVSAMGLVTLKKAGRIFLSLGLNSLAITGLLLHLDFVGLAFVYLTLVALAAMIIYFALRRKINPVLVSFPFDMHSRTSWYFIVSLLIFTGCLFLIAHTEVWQYAIEERTTTFGELWSSLIGSYSLLMIFAAVFVTLMAFILFKKHRQRDS